MTTVESVSFPSLVAWAEVVFAATSWPTSSTATHALATVEPVAPSVLDLAGQLLQALADAAVALYVLAEQIAMLLPLPVNPAAARHPLSLSAPEFPPVPE
jgi:hypothetical protein